MFEVDVVVRGDEARQIDRFLALVRCPLIGCTKVYLRCILDAALLDTKLPELG